MSSLLRHAWIKPVILSLLNPLIPLPTPPPLQISDYITNTSASPPTTLLILSDARHRIQAHLSPSAHSSLPTPLASLRGAFVTLNRYTLSYHLSLPGLPSTPLSLGDHFVLLVHSFTLLSPGGSSEVGQPHDCMQDAEVKAAMQTIKDIDLAPRRALVTANASTLFPHFTPRTTPFVPPSAALPPPALPAIPAELALWEPPTPGAYLLQYAVPPQAQAILDGLEPRGPSVGGEVVDEGAGELAPSQWSSSREEDEKAVFSQWSPARPRPVPPITRPVAPITSLSPSLPPSLPSAPSPPPPESATPHRLDAVFTAPELPRLEERPDSPSPLQYDAPPSPRNDEFYATQAPLSLISPPQSPLSLSSLGEEERGGAQGMEDDEEEKATGNSAEDKPADSLSQHNLPLSTFDVDALHEAAADSLAPSQPPQFHLHATQSADDSKAAPLSQMPDGHPPDSPADDADDVRLLELVPDPSPTAEPLTQAPLSQGVSQLSEEPSTPTTPPSVAAPSSTPPSRGFDLSLPPPSYPSSMPPLSPGTPSPQVSPQKAAPSPVREREPARGRSPERPASPLPRATIGVKREVKEAEEVGEEEAANLFSASSIQQRQQQRAQHLLSQRQGRQDDGDGVGNGTGAQKRGRGAESGGEASERGDDRREKRQRMVRFSDEDGRGVDERKDAEGAGEGARPMNFMVGGMDVELLAREPRGSYKAWSAEEYQLIVSYWRSRPVT